MKMMFHIDDFKCTLCSNWFCPPFNLPYLLPCTHSICTNCLQKASNNDHVICPQDLETCPIQSININLTTKRALERLMKQHKNYNENTQLECIKTLSISFDELLTPKQKKLRNLQALIDQIFQSEIDRLKKMHQKIKTDINRPYRVVEDWKQMVATHLTSIRKNHQNSGYDTRSNGMQQLNHYIEQGRKMKMEINQFFQMDFDIFADKVMRNPKICFDKDFSITVDTYENKLKGKTANKNNISQQIILDGRTALLKSKRQSKNQSIIQNQPTQNDEPIENNTVVFNSHSKRNGQNRQSKPLAAIDMNSMQISEFQYNQDGSLMTRRGTNRQKVQNAKVSQGKTKQMPNLQKYITFDLKNQNQSPIQKSRMSELTRNINKQVQFKNNIKQQLFKQNAKNNDSSLNSLNQFHLETPQQEHYQQNCQNRMKKVKQQTPKGVKNKNLIPQRQSPSLYTTQSQNERMNKLANMLDNRSSCQASQQLSTKNSRIRKSRRQIELKSQMSGQNSLLMSPNTIRQQYTQQAQSQGQYQQQQLLNSDESNWQLGHINFLKEWKLKSANSLSQPLQIKQNTYYYNCEKQKLNYIQKMQIMKVQQLYRQTEIGDNYIELINQSLHDVDINLYLQQFDWKHSNFQIVKLVKTDLKDEQLNILLNYIVNSNVKTLVLNHNHLTDVCLDAFLNFVNINKTLKNVHLANNPINTLKNKTKINTLKEKGIIIW